MSSTSSTPSALMSSLWSTLNDSLLYSLIDSSSSPSPPSATPQTSLSSDEEEQLRQFLSILEQFSQYPLLSSSSSRSIDTRILLPYLLIGMFIELIRMNCLNPVDILYILQSLIDILLNRIDCFNDLHIIQVFNLLLTFEYWSRVKLSSLFIASNGSVGCGIDTTSATFAASAAPPPSVSYHINNLEEYKLKLRLMSSTIYQNSQVKLKRIQELHTNNTNNSCRELSLQSIVNTSLEAAYTWALCQTFHMINTLKSNISNASTLSLSTTSSSSSSPSSYAKCNPSSQHKTSSIVQECILNAVNLKIIQTYSKNATTTNNNELNQPSLPYWLLAWLQCGVYMDETMNTTNSISTDVDNDAGVDDNQLPAPVPACCQHSIYWKRVTPIICLYEDELITAGNHLVANRSVQPSSSSTSPRKESGVLLPVVKQVLQKILFESGLIQLIPTNSNDTVYYNNNNDKNSTSSNEPIQECSNLHHQIPSSLTDSSIAWIFSQFSIVQGVYLMHICPIEHPMCSVLIHNILCQIFTLQLACLNSEYQQINVHKSKNLFTPGFLLLRCLPSSLFTRGGHSSYLPLLSLLSPTNALSDDQQSLFQLVVQKIRLLSLTNQNRQPYNASFTHDFNRLIDFLCEIDGLVSRSPFLNTNDNVINSKYSHLLDPTYQQSVIDVLLLHVNWNPLDALMHASHSLWITYQYMPKSNMNVEKHADDGETGLSTVSPESSLIRLKNEESCEHRVELSRSSFEVLFSTSSLMTLPSSIDQFSKYMKEITDTLRQHAKQMCDRIERIERLQNELHTNIIPKLYTPIRVKLLQYVECQSILPTWMPGYQPCSGGSNISCEYQTDKCDDQIQQLYQLHRSDLDKLIKTAIDISQIAACDVHNYYNDSSISSTGSTSSLSTDNKERLNQNWAYTVLQLQNSVSYLIHKSRLIHSELNSNHSAGTISSSTSSSSNNESTSVANQLQLVQSTGLQCFQQLCQNLSGHLLQCPLTKQIFANCVGELANEFLTSLSSQHELLLDMLVALPHLSNLLCTTFIPPNPCSNTKPNDHKSQHPLLPIYQRLMDIRFRCNAQTALNILEKINFKAWFSLEVKYYSKDQWNELILALFNCIQETTPPTTTTTTTNYSSGVNSTSSEENEDLHKLCIVHLKTLISNHYPDMFILAFQLLLQDLSNSKCIDIWILFQDLLTSDRDNHSGCSSLSAEQLTQLLTQVSRKLSSSARKSSVKSSSSTSSSSSSVVRDSQADLCDDDCSLMLQNNSQQTVQVILHVLTLLACHLCEKIGSCILNNHLSIQNGRSMIMDMLEQVFGQILHKCIILQYDRKFHTSSSSAAASPPQISSSMPSVSFIVYVKCCLEAFSDCLNSAIKACPSENNLHWSNQLINLFLIWFTSKTFVLNNFPHSLKTASLSTIPSNNYTQVHTTQICLPLIVYSALMNKPTDDREEITSGVVQGAKQDDQDDHNNNNEVEEKEQDDGDGESTLKWCLSSLISMHNIIWKPNLECLDAMIMVLLNCDHFVNDKYMKRLASNFMVRLLHTVQYWLVDQSTVQSTEVPELRNWLSMTTTTVSNALLHQIEKSMIKMDKAYVNSLTFLLVLITSGLQTSSSKCIKNQLKTIMENILSSLDLSIVSDTCYLYALSYLTEQYFPVHCVLMPPTTMEGRLFGLLAAAGGMISKSSSSPLSSELSIFSQNSSIPTNKSSSTTTTGLYPSLSNLHATGRRSTTPAIIDLHYCKRLAYLRKITSLLGYAVVLCEDGNKQSLDRLFVTDDFASLFMKKYDHQSPSSSSSSSSSMKSESSSSMLSVLWSRMSSMLPGSLTSHRNPISTIIRDRLSSLSTCDDNMNVNINSDNKRSVTSQCVKILTWLRVCNLLSELEAVTGHTGWEQSTSQEFKKITELCNEVISLVNRSSSRVEFLSKVSTVAVNKKDIVCTTTTPPPDLFVNAIIFWLLNNLNVNTRMMGVLGNNLSAAAAAAGASLCHRHRRESESLDCSVMPHSMNARLSRPFIHCILSMNSPIDQETTSRFAQLLNATIWSVIDNAPNEILSKDRFWGIYEIYSHNYFIQNKSSLIHSDLLISMCIQSSLHLPLLFTSLSRLDYFYRRTSIMSNRSGDSGDTATTPIVSANEYNVIIADCMHWLHSLGIGYINEEIDGQSFQLSGWILLVNFIINLITTRRMNSSTMNNEPCCSKHPAWSTQSLNNTNDNNNNNNNNGNDDKKNSNSNSSANNNADNNNKKKKNICPAEFHCKRLSTILNEFKTNLITQWKRKQAKLTEDQIQRITKMYNFLDCLCCLIDAWMISTSASHGMKNLEKLCSQPPHPTSSPPSSLSSSSLSADLSNIEEGCDSSSKQSPSSETPIISIIQESNPSLTSSIVSSLLIRLKSFTLLEAYRYVCLQFWSDLKPYVKEILQMSLTLSSHI